MNKFQPLALGIAMGIVWAVCVFLVHLFAMFGWGADFVETLGSLTSAMARRSWAQ